jgi:hypothetical protein
MTADEQRGDYGCALALASAQIVAASHRGEDTTPYVEAALSLRAPDDVSPVVALVTLLAAQADPDTSLSERLHWTLALDPQVVEACAVAS